MNPEPLPPTDDPQVSLALAKIEAKLDVAIAQHGAQLQDHERRIGSIEQVDREHDQRITANALTIAETREQTRIVASEARTNRTNLPVWLGLGVTVLLAILSPILTVLLAR